MSVKNVSFSENRWDSVLRPPPDQTHGSVSHVGKVERLLSRVLPLELQGTGSLVRRVVE